MNNNCTCGVKFMDAEDWRDHMPCPGNALEILQEQVNQFKLVADEMGDQNALLGMENDRLKLEIEKLNGYLMEYSTVPRTCGSAGCDQCYGRSREPCEGLPRAVARWHAEQAAKRK
jgi:hypothetical protein